MTLSNVALDEDLSYADERFVLGAGRCWLSGMLRRGGHPVMGPELRSQGAACRDFRLSDVAGRPSIRLSSLPGARFRGLVDFLGPLGVSPASESFSLLGFSCRKAQYPKGRRKVLAINIDRIGRMPSAFPLKARLAAFEPVFLLKSGWAPLLHGMNAARFCPRPFRDDQKASSGTVQCGFEPGPMSAKIEAQLLATRKGSSFRTSTAVSRNHFPLEEPMPLC